jgi:microsomal dipeptidase-like Zn-dependent dipeptidase
VAGTRFISFLVGATGVPKKGVLGKVEVLDPAGKVLAKNTLIALPPRFMRLKLKLGAKPKASAVRIAIRHDGPAHLLIDNLEQSAKPPPLHPKNELAQLYGFADQHTHFFTQIGQGGRLFAGRIHSCIGPKGAECSKKSSMAKALGVCEYHHGKSDGIPFADAGGVSTMVPEGGHDRSGYPYFKGWPRHTSLSHQQMYVDWLRRAWAGGLRLLHMDVLSNPIMAWAYKTTSILLPGEKLPNRVDEEWNIDAQLTAAKAFAKLPDVKTWLGIATTSQEAETLVRAGKLAVVLGVEADDLGGFTTGSTAKGEQFIALAQKAQKGNAAAKVEVRKMLREYLQKLHGKGVRHVFPVHLFDNIFGGSAVYDVKLDAGNYLFHGGLASAGKSGKFFETYNAWKSGENGEGIFNREDHEVRHMLDKINEYMGIAAKIEFFTKPEVVIPLLPIVLPVIAVLPIVNLALPALPFLLPTVHLLTKAVLELEKKIGIRRILERRVAAFPKVPARARLGIANKHGLFEAGRIFVEEAMRLGMIIDVAHMSDKATNDALAMAKCTQYPLIAGHTGFRETSFGTWTNNKCKKLSFGRGEVCTNKYGYFTDPVVNKDVGWSPGTQSKLGTGTPEHLAAERSLSAKQVDAIRELGGLVGLGTGISSMPRAWGGKGKAIAPDCDGTTKAFVQQYRYALSKMGTQGGIAFGTDANGFVPGVGPRF